MDEKLATTVGEVHDYWNTHTLGFKSVTDRRIEPGTAEFFAHIQPWMNPYKFPWIMERIERESKLLKGKHLLEIGCGMGYDSLEFLKRGDSCHGDRSDPQRGGHDDQTLRCAQAWKKVRVVRTLHVRQNTGDL